MQGLPASILGIVVYLTLKDRPEDASWLNADEKRRLRAHLDDDVKTVEVASHGSLLDLLRDPKVFSMALVYFLFLGANYTLVFFMPTLLRSWGIADVFTIGLLAAIPAVVGMIGMVLVGRSSDTHMERRRHFLFCVALAAGGLLLTVLTKGNMVLGLIGLSIMAIGQSANTPIFFAAVSEYLPKKSAAGGIALISSLGNLGPAAMPVLMTWISTRTGSSDSGMYITMALWMLAGMLLMTVVRQSGAVAPRLATA